MNIGSHSNLILMAVIIFIYSLQTPTKCGVSRDGTATRKSVPTLNCL